MKVKMSETCHKLFHGEVTIQKRELWLIAACCLLAGALYGLKKAPWTHGVTIGSNNGNNNNGNSAHLKSEQEKEEVETCTRENNQQEM